jgi:hypothetical protein
MNNDIDFNTIDELGMINAQIADLTAKAEAIKDAMKDIATRPGAGNVFEGAIFKATVVEQNRTSTNWLKLIASKVGVEIAAKEDAKDSWEKVAIKLGFGAEELPEAITKHTTTTAVFAVKVTSR